MALTTFLTSSAALQRPAFTQDAGGAAVKTFATVSGKGALACAVWPAGSSMASVFGQMAIKGDHLIAFAADPTAKPGDRISVGGSYYLVNGFLPYANGAISAGSLYLVDATLWTK